MALVGVELETFVSEPDALTTRPPPCAADAGKLEILRSTVELPHNYDKKSFKDCLWLLSQFLTL